MNLFQLLMKTGKAWNEGGLSCVTRKAARKIVYKTVQYDLERMYHVKDACPPLVDTLQTSIQNMECYFYLKGRFQSVLDRAPAYPLQTTPVKKIWWCWLQGEEAAPALPKACLHSLRKHFPEYEIHVVTEANMLDYVTFPDYILDKYHHGIISHTHFSDILRTLLLVEHGGIWMDSTVFATSHAFAEEDGPFREPLFFFSSWMREDESMVGSSWMISAAPGHPVLCLTRDLLFAYWKTYDTLLHYFIFHFFFHMACEFRKDLWEAVPRYSNIPPHVMQFELFRPYDARRYRQILSMSPLHKLTRHKTEETEGDVRGTLYAHIIATVKEDRKEDSD